MAGIGDSERDEMLRLASSAEMREDMAYLRAHRHNPVLVAGVADMDRLVEFLTQFNEFINHQPRPFTKIIDRDMKL